MKLPKALLGGLLAGLLVGACADDMDVDGPAKSWIADGGSFGYVDGGLADASFLPPGFGDAASSFDSGLPWGASATDASATDTGITNSGATDAASAPDATVSADAGSLCDSLTYASFGKQWLATYCPTCHTGLFAQRGIQLDTLAGVQRSKAAIKREAVTGTSMPNQNPRPSAAERQKLGQWLDCGPK